MQDDETQAEPPTQPQKRCGLKHACFVILGITLGLFALLIIIALLVPPTDDDTPTTSPTQQPPEPTREPPPTRAPTPTPRSDCDVDGMLRYAEVMGPPIDEVTTSSFALASLFGEMAEDPFVLTDSSWQRELELELGTWESSARSINRIVPPATFRASHREWESAADKILRAASLIRQGVENLDTDSLFSATTLFEEIGAHFIRGTTELNQWTDRCGT